MWNNRSLNVATSLLIFLVCSLYPGVDGQIQGRTQWTKISSSREGKTLRNTFPFSQTAAHDHHHHHHGAETSNSRRLSPESLPRRDFNPPTLDTRGSRQRGNQGGGGEDISLDIGSIAAAGERCIDKVVMIQTTEYDDVITCKHSYSEKCHTTYLTDYTPQQEEKCEENFKKNCFIEFKKKASDEKVQFCFTPLLKNCEKSGPEECTTEYTSACQTRYHEHDVEDDHVECFEEAEQKCESQTQGYTTSEKCTNWPVRKCGRVEQKTTKKYSPETECRKVPIELCGPGACPTEPGPEECQERTQTIVQEVPEETCNLEPQRICKHVTKLVPHLKATENCIDIPKEVCSRSRTNPRTVDKPIIKKWCYTPAGPTSKRPPPPPTEKPTRKPTRGPGGGGDSNQGNGEEKTKEQKTTDIEKTKRKCKTATFDKCDTRQLKRDKNDRRKVDQESLCKAGVECQVRECGWLGGTCETVTIPPAYLPPPPPKNTYLPPPKTGY